MHPRNDPVCGIFNEGVEGDGEINELIDGDFHVRFFQLQTYCCYDSICRRVIRFISMVFVPLVLRIIQNRDLVRR